ncbi:zinc ribbon domain-containing protein, partial [Streptomyces sp. NPDC057654]|uniref:zinc ribbon domain-containing protein n=1 Tax=Streptomyces sp. NPDC057654 TaxID=3346196 RepID=UPI00369C0518
MSQMPQLPQLAVCPECAEPLEAGDNFCGGCGADLSAGVPAAGERPAGEHPAAASNGAARAQQGPQPYARDAYAQADAYAPVPEDYPLAAPAGAADPGAAPEGGGGGGADRPYGQT